MADSDLRGLQRAFQLAPGDVATEIAFLRERLRTGNIALERVELAAYCGHTPAQRLLKPEATLYNEWCSCDLPGPGHGFHSDSCEMRPWQFERWISGLDRWPREALVRAAVAAARAAAKELLRVPTWPLPPVVAIYAAIDSVETWLKCPCPEHRQAAFMARRTGYAEAAFDAPTWALEGQVAHTVTAICDAARIATKEVVREAMRSVLRSWSLT